MIWYSADGLQYLLTLSHPDESEEQPCRWLVFQGSGSTFMCKVGVDDDFLSLSSDDLNRLLDEDAFWVPG